MIIYNETPLLELKNQIIEQSGVRVLVKREDLNHPLISGNKWWKLKYNLEEALRLQKKMVLTFGGAYSNHIYASAAAAEELGLKSVGIIRGEETLPLNPTLSFAKACGMELLYVSREAYRRKSETEFVTQLHHQFGDFYLIPEGGTNHLAIKGCAEFGKRLIEEIDFDYVCMPVGTGGTIAGIVEGLNGQKQVIGFSSLKDGEFLNGEISKYTQFRNWQLNQDYHFGGYAKTTKALLDFARDFERDFEIPLDPVYTSKMMFGVFDLMRQGYFKKGSVVLVLHTGGLQGKIVSFG
ncbi:MAG TPA: pyridoxal-phosphate dependent enzyme [Cyclobacteriaceae bacterium]|nr:pyridoxal-phosphate dependent enzyme [Cyclobacteriaceae bacterium]